MAVVAEPQGKIKDTSIRAGIQAVSRRPWILIVATVGAMSGWLLHPELDPSGLARSFALPPLDVYADGIARSRGWGVFAALLLVRWTTILLFVAALTGRILRFKELTAPFGVYTLAALSYAVPFNLGRSFLMSSIDETSMMPAALILVTPIVLLAATRLFTQLLLRSLHCPGSVGWVIPILSLAIWTVSGTVLDGAELSAVTTLAAFVVVSIQGILLSAAIENRP